MFEDSTFESTGRIRTRSRRWMFATFALNGSVLLALIVIPLIFPEALPRHFIPVPLTAPPPPAAPRQMAAQDPIRAVQSPHDLISVQLAVPRKLTVGFARSVGSEAPSGALLTMDQGSSVVGSDVFRSSPPAAVQPAPRPRGPEHISSGVAAGLLIQRVMPQYSALQKAIRVEGTVVLQAVISKSGTIENLRVASGPAMLQQAAIDAVKQWRYRPYMLDGEPVEVETTISVIFSMSH